MEFDIVSMKQRAKSLMQSTKPSVWLIGLIFGILAFGYAVFDCVVIETSGEDVSKQLLIMLIAELIYLNIRSSCNFYCLKVTREEKTSISDVFAAFKEHPIQTFFLGLIKDICYIIGFICLYVGYLVVLYWFRFSVYVIKDEGCNPFKAMGKSMKLLKGHYRELIKLDISNIGWFALMFFTLGLAAFYVKPYTTLVYAEFYDYLKAQNTLFE
jgi:hypothetical protein